MFFKKILSQPWHRATELPDSCFMNGDRSSYVQGPCVTVCSGRVTSISSPKILVNSRTRFEAEVLVRFLAVWF